MNRSGGPPSTEVVRQPSQRRSRESLEAIYRASTELLAEGGWDAVRIAEVERRSGVSRGTLYWRFPSLDVLVGYVRERIVAEVVDEQRRAFVSALEVEPSDLSEAVDLAVHAMAAVFGTYGALIFRMDNPTVTAFDVSTIDALGDDFAAIISPWVRSDVGGRRALEHATRSVFANLVSVVRRRDPFSHQLPVTWDEGLGLISAATTAYLATVSTTPAAD